MAYFSRTLIRTLKHEIKDVNNCFVRSTTQKVKVGISEHVTSALSVVNAIFKFKSAKATSVVVENKLRDLLFYYDNLRGNDKEEFLQELATRYSVNHDVIVNVSKQLIEMEPEGGLMLRTEGKLRELLTPQYSYLFTHLGRLEGGVKFLVDLRSDILDLLSKTDAMSPHQLAIQQLNSSLRELLNLWFSVGFMNLEKITWSSPCCLLEKVAEYEAVHPVRSWTDIRQRVGQYRRCFVFTHHSMPGEPLVVLHVALTPEISDSTMSIIKKPTSDKDKDLGVEMSLREDPHAIKAFVFYSISSTQKGLQGIDLGNYLIKRACKELHAEYPRVKQLSSLSPIPTFRKWLLEKLKAAEKGEVVFPSCEWDPVLESIDSSNTTEAWTKLRSMIADNSWIHDDTIVKLLRGPIMAACCRYLYHEKRRGYAFDSVANFHLRNGAKMWRLNWLADTSARGLNNSCGLMVNYRYYLDVADANSLKYVQNGFITVSEEIERMAEIGP